MMSMSATIQKPDFARAASRLASTQIRARERRRFRRAPLIVTGRMLDPLGREHDCRTADLSPGDVRLSSAILPDVGHRVVLYLEGFGRLSGSVARRCGEAEVAIVFEQSNHKREKMAEALTLAMNKSIPGLEEIERRVPEIQEGRLARIEFETGEVLEGEVLDFSLAGMTIRTAKAPPPLGAWVRVGNSYGRVARRVEGGFAIDFEPRSTQ
jgi:hypothetical protein